MLSFLCTNDPPVTDVLIHRDVKSALIRAKDSLIHTFISVLALVAQTMMSLPGCTSWLKLENKHVEQAPYCSEVTAKRFVHLVPIKKNSRERFCSK